jgi:hypothetical protein
MCKHRNSEVALALDCNGKGVERLETCRRSLALMDYMISLEKTRAKVRTSETNQNGSIARPAKPGNDHPQSPIRFSWANALDPPCTE